MSAPAQLTLFPQLARSDDLAEERALVAYLKALGAADVPTVSASERDLLRRSSYAVKPGVLRELRSAIRDGDDPLGAAFAQLRSPAERRPLGATYTPLPIVAAMVEWAATHAVPDRVVDPGVGSARFLVSAGHQFSEALLVGLEIDPLAALVARANLAVNGFTKRAWIALEDYRSVALAPIAGRTLFIGNPPYVRHHLIDAKWKEWLVTEAKARGHAASQLAGLHVHFFLATVKHGAEGDFGALLTAAEWLDVNYGKLVRDLFLNGLGGEGIVVVEPTARPFPDAATTAAITTFELGNKPTSIRLGRVQDTKELAENLSGGALVRRERLSAERRWTPLLRSARQIPSDYVELGELCRVHRGAVTGANRIWIAGEESARLPKAVLYPSVTKARELFRAGDVLADAKPLRCVIDLPADLDVLESEDRKAVDAFLAWAKTMGADRGYIARHRKAWWSVGLRAAPPIMATYMARRPPAFVENQAGARYINIAHGIYPREPMSPNQLHRLAAYLTQAGRTANGRTYAGGLMKFEPREMERIAVPRPEAFAAE